MCIYFVFIFLSVLKTSLIFLSVVELINCMRFYYPFRRSYDIAFEFPIDMQQSIVNATVYIVAKSFIIILEHKTILDIHHNCL
jgi:hypothetical protein